MNLKKGFTLAEIILVLAIIGVIAALSIPTAIKSVDEANFKASYKKAYSEIVEFTSARSLLDKLPHKRSAKQAAYFYKDLVNSSHISYFIKENPIDGGIIEKPFGPNVLKSSFNLKVDDDIIKITANAGGSSKGTARDTGILEGVAPGLDKISTWLQTTDDIAYAVMVTSDDNSKCVPEADISGKISVKDALEAACVLVVVDVNGLHKGPNRLEAQSSEDGKPGADVVGSKDKLSKLTGDRYYIYIGSDGASPGPEATSVSGRLIGDVK